MVVSPSHSMFSTVCLFRGWLSCVTLLARQRNFQPSVGAMSPAGRRDSVDGRK